MKLKRESAILWGEKIIICALSLALLGLGCGINVIASQGADPITIFYEGLSKITGISVGMVANILNTTLVLSVFFINRKYVHIGTLIYLFVLGTFIDFGIWAYNYLNIPSTFVCQLAASLVGCLLCFIGLGGFMSIDIGIDPWDALAVILSKKLNKSFRLVKVILDLLTLLFGWLMGGKVGIITIFCAVAGGPIIQKSAEILDKVFTKMLKSKCES